MAAVRGRAAWELQQPPCYLTTDGHPESASVELKDPAENVHRFRVRQDRRQHLEHQIKGHGCDLDCVTDRTGSPQTLVCTKNTASFEERLKKYREDLSHLAALRSIQKSLPT
jgi:hypothetical protein